MPNIAVLGLGKMGSALAAALIAAGHSVRVWNRSPEKAAPLVDLGGTRAGTPREAVGAADVIIICVRNHAASLELLTPVSDALAGKTVIDLSTGGAAEAEALVEFLTEGGANWLIGMINAYPSGVGKQETAILCAGPDSVWAASASLIKDLGGASAHVGVTPAAIPGLFAAMFTARQGMMFGMIFGAAVCRKAGLPLQSFADQIPVTLQVAGDYADLFVRSVPSGQYDDPGASLHVYADALEDVMATYADTGAPDTLPRLMRDLAQRGVDEGLGDKELTALVEVLTGG